MNYLLTSVANGNDPIHWYFYTGLIAAACITIFCLPALIKIIKTKDTSGVSITMYIIYSIGCLFWLISSIGMLVDNNLSGGIPMCISNGIAAIIAIIILSFKCRNLGWAKKYGVTEKEIAKDYFKYVKLAKEAKAKAKAKKAEAKSKKADDKSKKLDDINKEKEQSDLADIG